MEREIATASFRECEPSRKLVNRVVRGCSQALTSMVFAVTITTVTIRLGLPGKGNRRYSLYARSYARREPPTVGRKLCRRGLGCPHSTLRGKCNISCAARRGCHRN